MTEPTNNIFTAMRGMEVLKNKIVKLGGRCLQESRPQNHIMLEIETPVKQRMHLRLKTMTSGGWKKG